MDDRLNQTDVAIIGAGPVGLFAVFVQSDYAAAWLSNGESPTPRMPKWIRNLPRYSSFRVWLRGISIVHWFDNWLTGQRQLRQFSLKNKRLFKKVQ